MHSIGIDIGKTNIKLVVVDSAGAVIHREQVETPHDAQVINLVCELAKRHRDDQSSETTTLGLSAPGLAGTDHRMITCLPGNQPAIQGVDWQQELALPTGVTILNDANAALFAESKIGAAVGYQHAVLLTLGTGVGGSVLVNGQLLHGKSGKAGHLGHISIHPDWTRSILGMPGSLEYAFGDWSVRERSDGQFESTLQLAEACQSGNKTATKLWHDAIGHLARGIASLTNVLDPEVVVIGGGITRAGDTLFKPLRDAVAELEWRPTGFSVPIVPAKLGAESGAIGAALFAVNQTSREAPS